MDNFSLNIQDASRELGVSFWLQDLVPFVAHPPETVPDGSFPMIFGLGKEVLTSNLCLGSFYFKPKSWYFDTVFSASCFTFI